MTTAASEKYEIVPEAEMRAMIAAANRGLDFIESLFGTTVRCRECDGEGVVFACRAGLSDEADVCPDCGGEGSISYRPIAEFGWHTSPISSGARYLLITPRGREAVASCVA